MQDMARRAYPNNTTKPKTPQLASVKHVKPTALMDAHLDTILEPKRERRDIKPAPFGPTLMRTNKGNKLL